MSPVLDPISQFIIKFFAASLVCSGAIFICACVILLILIAILIIKPDWKFFGDKEKFGNFVKITFLHLIPLVNIVMFLCVLGTIVCNISENVGNKITKAVYNRHMKYKN